MNHDVRERVLNVQAMINTNLEWKTLSELSQMALLMVDSDNKYAIYFDDLEWKEHITKNALIWLKKFVGDGFDAMNVFFDLKFLGIVYYIENNTIKFVLNVLGQRAKKVCILEDEKDATMIELAKHK